MIAVSIFMTLHKRVVRLKLCNGELSKASLNPHVADVRKCIISILSYPDGCQDVGYGDDRGSTMPDI